MSTVFWRETTQVRRKGKIETVERNGDDVLDTTSGDRRSRQIGRRHWVRKVYSAWSSGGYDRFRETMKRPGHSEFHLRAPRGS